MKKIAWLAVAVAFLFFAAKPSNADPLQISCIGVTSCQAGGIQTTASSTVDFNLVMANGKYAGNAYLAFLVPVGDAPLGFGKNEGTWKGKPSTLGDFLTFTNSQHNYSSSQSFSPSSGGYDVFLVSLGAFNGPLNFSTSGLSSGTLIVGYDVITTTKKGVTTTSILTTPWSESLDATTGGPMPTPEPASLFLLGTGLLGLGAMARRRLGL